MPQQPDAQSLMQRLAALGARPFLRQVVQSAWDPIIDVDSLHANAKRDIRELLKNCKDSSAIRCLTIVGEAGTGKTHLLAWTRHHLENQAEGVLICVPPFLPGSPGSDTLEQHVMRAAYEALYLRAISVRNRFRDTIRAFLVECYDSVIETGHRIKETLRVGTAWSRAFRRSTLKIGKRGKEFQLSALQKAFVRSEFFARAFEHFEQQVPMPRPDGRQIDRDTFVVACLLACGDTRQHFHADRWLRGEGFPAEVLAPFHIEHPCLGTNKILNGLFTLNRLLGQVFCVAFDQLEDTAEALRKTDGRLDTLLLGLVRPLSVIPSFAMIFGFQKSYWSVFYTRSDKMLTDRMTEGYGAHELSELDKNSAEQLIRQRLEAAVWNGLGITPPTGLPACFPFPQGEIERMRKDTNGDLRPFLKLAQETFDSLLENRPSAARIRLLRIDPQETTAYLPAPVLISGENLPGDVRVFFGEQEAHSASCRPTDGEIDAATPPGLVGDIVVRIESREDPENFACLTLRFRDSVKRPYCRYIDPEKLKKRRNELGMTQQEVAQNVYTTQPNISAVERGVKKDAPDELYIQLADLYEQPLASFLKDQSDKDERNDNNT